MGYRWRGFAHPELYTMINSGPGPAASEPQTTYWQSLATELTEVDLVLNKKLTDLGATWEGEAAERARTGLTPLARWAGDAESGATVMRISTENQAEYIADARARMPEPVPVTTPEPSAWSVATGGAAALTGDFGPALSVVGQAIDHEEQEAAQSEAEQRAVETMRLYEKSSTWNRETLGTFVAPPDVVVTTPAPRGAPPAFVDGRYALAVDTGSGSHQTTTVNGHVPPSPGGGNGLPPLPGGGQGGGSGSSSISPSITTGASLPPQLTTPASTVPQTVPPPTPPLTPGEPPRWPGTPHHPYDPAWQGQRGPFPAHPVNAGDVARTVQPLRGLPTGLDPDVSRAQFARGGGPVGLPGESGVLRTGPAPAAGVRGGAAGPVGGRAEGEDDDEYYGADYLLESGDVFGDADLPVAPTVIGGPTPQQ